MHCQTSEAKKKKAKKKHWFNSLNLVNGDVLLAPLISIISIISLKNRHTAKI